MRVEGAGEPASRAFEDLGERLGDVDGRSLATNGAEHEVIAVGGAGLGGLVNGDGRGDGRMDGHLAGHVAAARVDGVGTGGLGGGEGVGGTGERVGGIADVVEMGPLLLHVEKRELHRVVGGKHVGRRGSWSWG